MNISELPLDYHSSKLALTSSSSKIPCLPVCTSSVDAKNEALFPDNSNKKNRIGLLELPERLADVMVLL